MVGVAWNRLRRSVAPYRFEAPAPPGCPDRGASYQEGSVPAAADAVPGDVAREPLGVDPREQALDLLRAALRARRRRLRREREELLELLLARRRTDTRRSAWTPSLASDSNALAARAAGRPGRAPDRRGSRAGVRDFLDRDPARRSRRSRSALPPETRAVTLDPYNAFLAPGRRTPTATGAVAVKDVIDVAGHADDGGVEDPRTACPSATPSASRGSARPGATIVGKLNTHEFAFGALTNSPHFGPARNPWDLERIDRRLERRQRRGRRRRARRRRARHRHGRLDPDPGRASAGSPATGRPRASSRTTASSRSRGRFDTVGPLARTAEECRACCSEIDGRSPARPAARAPPDRRRHQAVRARPTPASPRSARRRPRRCPGDARAGRAAAARGDRDDHAAGHAPRGGRRPPAAGCGRGSPTTAPTSARACSPGCSCRRRPT